MSKKYDVYSEEGKPQYPLLRSEALEVAKQFPNLSASAFFEELRGRFYPRPDEYDMRALVLRLVSDRDLEYTINHQIKLVK